MARNSKSALLIVASKSALESAGVDVVVASNGPDRATSTAGKTTSTDDYTNINVNDYDAIVFIGGPGAKVLKEDKTALDIAKQSLSQKKVTAAICMAVSVLANAGLLKGKKATAYAEEKGNLEKKGAIFTGSLVEVTGNIVTGNGPSAATKFGKTIADILTSLR